MKLTTFSPQNFQLVSVRISFTKLQLVSVFSSIPSDKSWQESFYSSVNKLTSNAEDQREESKRLTWTICAFSCLIKSLIVSEV